MREEKIGVTILTIVFIGLIAVLFFFFEPRYTGLAVGVCTDSDDGQDIYIKGTTDDGITTWTDACIGEDVKEGYCDTGVTNTVDLPCPAGYTCSDGACITTTTSTESTISTSITTSSSTTITETTSSSSSSTESTASTSITTSSSSSSSTTSVAGSSTTSTSTSSSSSTSILNSTSNDICVPDWQCDDWGECINGVMGRKCVDTNNCGFDDTTEKEACSTASSIETTIAEEAVEEIVEESGENVTKNAAGDWPTGLAIANTRLVGEVAAGIIWGVVILGVAGYMLNRYQIRWWLRLRHGTSMFTQDTGDVARAGLIRARYKIRNWIGRNKG